LLIALAVAYSASLQVMAQGAPSMRDWIDRSQADLNTLEHRYRVPGDEAARNRRHTVLQQWLLDLQNISYSTLNFDEQVDYQLLKNDLQRKLSQLQRERTADAAAMVFLPMVQL
jgi:uncharacterized protein (DUF885 family)